MTTKNPPTPRTIPLLLAAFLIGIPAQAQYGGGTGEPNDPYLIYTAAQMNAIGADPNHWDRHFKLMADIDLSLTSGPVLNQALIAPRNLLDTHIPQDTPFRGTFDGNHHVIRNLRIVGGHYLGLFGRLAAGAQVSNLGLVDSTVTGTGSCIGTLAGESCAVVSNCYSTGAVSGHSDVGGLVGRHWLGARLLNSYSTSDIEGVGNLGGLAGSNWGSIVHCHATGTVSVQHGSYGQWRAGGVAGGNHGHIVGCYSTGRVNGEDDVGGLVGDNGLVIINCYSTGRVSGHKNVGALIGNNIFGGVVSNCYSTGKASGDEWAGGLIGTWTGWPGTVTGCLYDRTGLRADEMQNVQTYLDAGWDFVGETENGLHEFWQMPEGGGYPVLSIFQGFVPAGLGGQGTPDDPYLISTPADLGAVLYHDPQACYRLTRDVNLSGITWSMPVIPEFGGVFDGDGFAIGHLTISAGGILGLFGALNEAAVRDLSVLDADVTGTGDATGILAAMSNGATITNSRSTGTIKGGNDVGGLVGLSVRGLMSGCYSTASIQGEEGVGGLVGWHWSGTMNNCYCRGKVCGDLGAGGLIGFNSGVVSNSYSVGAVSGQSPHSVVAGFVASNDEGSVNNSFWDVQASGLSVSAAGLGLKTAQMYDIGTYLEAGWDFMGETANGTEDIWWIDEGKDYPRLWWEAPGE